VGSKQPTLLVAVALLIGFYVLALTVALAAIALILVQWTTDVVNNPFLTLSCVVVAFTILGSIVPRRIRFHPPGPELVHEDQPKLVALIEDVAKRVGQQMPERVYLTPEMNAAADQHGGLLGLGGRRHLEIGLPLLDVLTVTQLRAVVAHEFGHFHSGDTRLLPWFTRTYDALERTVISLDELESFWQKPFEWYLDFYLKRTSSVRRRQEFVADELSARVVGSEPAAAGLELLTELAPAYEEFWDAHAVPALLSGYRVPLLEGFRRYRKAAPVRDEMEEALEEQWSTSSDPYGSHPSISERLAALAVLDNVAAAYPEDRRIAIELTPDPDALELSLLEDLTGDEGLQDFECITWEDVPERVVVPIWRHAFLESSIPEATAAGLPDVLPNVEERALLGVGLCLALLDAGWSIHAPPGEAVAMELGDEQIEPFVMVEQLAEGTLSADHWRARVHELGIADLPIGAGSQASDLAEPQA
jgi:Zn-dependent protease with chaperone function